MLLQNIAVFQRNDSSSTSSDETSEESDSDTSNTPDSGIDLVHSEQHKDNNAQQTTHSCQLPRIKMPKTSSKRRIQPQIEVIQDPDNNNGPDMSSEQLH